MVSTVRKLEATQNELCDIIKGESNRKWKLIKQQNQETRSMFRDLIEIAKENNQQEVTNSVNMNEITNKMEECSTALIDKMEQIWSKIQLSQKSEKKF